MRPISGGMYVLTTITALLVGCVCLQIESFTANPVAVIGMDGIFPPLVDLQCLLTNPPADVVTRWIYGNSVYTNASESVRHNVTFDPEFNVLNVRITSVGYADNGTYVCEAKSAADDMWMWARLELVLQVQLEPGVSVMTYDNASMVELACEMSGYAPPNSLLKWYRGDIVLSNDSKYSVLYRDSPNSPKYIQRGNGEESSILGVLVVFNPAQGDSGTYHCRIDGFSLQAEVQLQVESPTIVIETINGVPTEMSQTINYPVGPTTDSTYTTSMSLVPMSTSAAPTRSLSVTMSYLTTIGMTQSLSTTMPHPKFVTTTNPLDSTIFLSSTAATYLTSVPLTYSIFITQLTPSSPFTVTPILSLSVTSSVHQVQSSAKDNESGSLPTGTSSMSSLGTVGPVVTSSVHQVQSSAKDSKSGSLPTGTSSMSSLATVGPAVISSIHQVQSSAKDSKSGSPPTGTSSMFSLATVGPVVSFSSFAVSDLPTQVTIVPASFSDISLPTPSVESDGTTDDKISLLFVFVMVVMSLLLLIGLALVLLVCLCFCQRRSKKSLGQSNRFNRQAKTNRIPLEIMEVVKPPSRAHSEASETLQPSAVISSHSTEPEGLFLLAHNQTTTFTDPQELLAYNISQNMQSLPPPPIAPRNSARGSILQQIPPQAHQGEPGVENDYDEPGAGNEKGMQSPKLKQGSSDQQQQPSAQDLQHPEYMEPADMLKPSAGKAGRFNPYEDDIEPELGPRIVKASPTPTESDAKSTSPESNCHDYDHIYCEALEPSMMKEAVSPVGQGQDSLPYAPIYDLPKGSKRYNHPFHISPRSIKIIQQLGIGQFGKVFLAATIGVSLKDLQLNNDHDRTRSLLVAVKQLKSSADQKLKSNFHKEIRFMIRLKHANVIRLLAICTSTATPFIMMEYMENGDLNEFLRKQQLQPDSVQSLDINEVTPMILLYISVQIASGMRYLTSKQFIHRDLAARNCLVGRDFVIKISDFGMSRNLYESSYYRITGHLILPIRWMASETFFGRFSVKSDSWAYGVTIWEIFTLCQNVPYHDMTDQEVISDAIRGASRKVLPKPDPCPDEVYDVMKRCFVHLPGIRGDFEEIYSRMFMVYSTLSQQA